MQIMKYVGQCSLIWIYDFRSILYANHSLCDEEFKVFLANIPFLFVRFRGVFSGRSSGLFSGGVFEAFPGVSGAFPEWCVFGMFSRIVGPFGLLLGGFFRVFRGAPGPFRSGAFSGVVLRAFLWAFRAFFGAFRIIPDYFRVVYARLQEVCDCRAGCSVPANRNGR